MLDVMPEFRARTDQIRTLVTGFGPFPGVDHNLSAQFARRAADHLTRNRLAHHVALETLPVRWGAAERATDALIDAERPSLVVHFGVARNAHGFELERQAVALANHTPDAEGFGPDGRDLTPVLEARVAAAGILPPPMANGTATKDISILHRLLQQVRRQANDPGRPASMTTHLTETPPPPLRLNGPNALRTRLPLQALAHALRRRNLRARVSRDAGRYLCNAVYYRSLMRRDGVGGLRDALFVHVPAFIDAEGRPLTGRGQQAALLSGAADLIELLVERHAATRF